ncbi:MAG: serine hydrolase [Pseudomonadota bacterium]
MRVLSRFISIFAGFALLSTASHAQAPFIDPADDQEHFGAPENALFWTPEQQVAGYRNADQIFWTRTIRAGDTPLALSYARRDLASVELNVGAETMSLDEYFIRQSVAGLLVIKDGEIVYERYGLGNDENSRWISYSVAKSVTSLLIGAAVQDGYIESVDDAVTDYLPRLKGSAYDGASIADLLHMASGVAWDENYADPNSDVATAPWETIDLYEFLREKSRVAPAGEAFNYNTAETNLAGTLLRSAIGNNLSTYLSEKIWRPFGMEADASWNLTEPGGGEFGGCCINATLRDYGRLGLFALANGRLQDGTQVLPANWMSQSTIPSQGFAGYGYLWWLEDGGVYSASGIFGQGIYIAPADNIVIALHSARPDASRPTDWAWQDALFESIVGALQP